MKKLTFILIAILSVIIPKLSNDTFQEDRLIKGMVIDKDSKEPILFGNVKVVGANIGTQTDIDGRFEIAVAKGFTKLEASYTGYKTATIEIGEKDFITIELSAEVMILDEIVVYSHSKSIYNKKARITGINSNSYTPSGYSPSSDQVDNFNTEDYDFIQENIFHSPLTAPLSTFSIDVDGSSYSNMRRFLDYGQQPPKDAVRIEELVNYFDYDYEQPTGDHPFSFTTELSDCPWQPKHKLLHIGLQGKSIDPSELPPSNLVFLFDVSGSMSDYNKLPLVKQSFKILLDNLRPQDRVAIVVYAGAAGLVLKSTPGNLKKEIQKALENLQAGGSTAGGEGIKLAYNTARENFIKGGNNRIILATDGDFNVGASSDSELERMIEKERESGVFLTVLGFGMGNYKDNKMQKLANKGNGNHAYIDNISEARKIFLNEFGGTLFTIAKDVKIQAEFNPENVQAYRLVGYENRMLESEDFNNDKKDAGEIGAGHTVTALYEIIPVGVKSDFVKSVDDLKFQHAKSSYLVNQHINDWMHLKFRYKKPDGDTSILLEHAVTDKMINKNSSDNLNWSAAVASFGMILRESEFVGKSNYQMVLELAKSSKGTDQYGYRGEFIQMVENMRTLAGE